MAEIINGTIATGGTPQNALNEGHHHKAVILKAVDSDLYFNLDANAGDGVGELVAAGSSTPIAFSSSVRLSVWSADTSAAYSLRPSLIDKEFWSEGSLNGGGTPNTPIYADPRFIRWYEADALSLANNDPVATWTDLSAPGVDATQVTAGSRPLFKTNQIDGQPAVYFDGTNDYLDIGDLSGLTEAEVFLIVKIDNDPPGADAQTGLWTLNNLSNSADHYSYTDGILYIGFGSTARKTVGNPTPSLTSWRVVNIHSAVNDWAFKLDGSTLHSTASNTVGFNTPFYLGRSDNRAGDISYLQGYVVALGIANEKLDTTTRDKVYDYFRAKYPSLNI